MGVSSIFRGGCYIAVYEGDMDTSVFIDSMSRYFGSPIVEKTPVVISDLNKANLDSLSEQDWFAVGMLEKVSSKTTPFSYMILVAADEHKRSILTENYIASDTRNTVDVVFADTLEEAEEMAKIWLTQNI